MQVDAQRAQSDDVAAAEAAAAQLNRVPLRQRHQPARLIPFLLD